MNYFEFYQIPISFKVEKAKLKKTFYLNSKKYHPDYFTLEDEEKQTEILELSTLNNKAFQTLSDFDKRMKYVLDLKGVLEVEGKNQIPQSFLMEMMEINEQLMELEFDFNMENFLAVQKQLENFELELWTKIQPTIDLFEDKPEQEEALVTVKDYYFKKRYLIRIKENLLKMQNAQ